MKFISMNKIMSRCSVQAVLFGALTLAAVSASAKDLPGATQISYGVSSSGSFQFQIPIVVPAGRNGIQPNLSLSFSNGGGNGPLGVGWGLSGLSSISRCGRTFAVDGINGGVLHDSNDRFCLNGRRLIKVAGSGVYGAANSEYRTEVDEISKVVAYGSTANLAGGSAPTHFKVWRKDGMILSYGTVANTRFSLPGSGSIHSWKLYKAEDRNGNHYTVSYEGSYSLPSEITYVGGHKVAFKYDSLRSDARSQYMLGQKFTYDQRLNRIEVTRNNTIIRSYDLAYLQSIGAYNLSNITNITNPSANTEKSRLASVTECGQGGVCMPSININWETDSQGFVTTSAASNKAPEALIEHYDYQQYIEPGVTTAATKEINRGNWADVNGDGLTDVVIAYIAPNGTPVLRTYIKTSSGWEKHEEGTTNDTWQLPEPLRNYEDAVTNMYTAFFKSEVVNQGQFIDVDGDGLLDIVYAYKLDREIHQYKGQVPGTPSDIEDVKITYLNTGNGWEESPAYKPKDYLFDYFTGPFGYQGVSTQRGQFVDINGDGLVDWITAIHFRQSPLTSRQETYLNTGTGWVLNTDYKLPTYFNEYFGNHSWGRAELVDVNGDGLLDLVEAYKSYWDNNYNLVANTWINDGTKFVQDNSFNLLEAIYENNGQTYSAVKRGSFVDVNGDGLADFMRSFIAWNHANVQQAALINKGRGWVYDANYKPDFVHIDYTYIGHTGDSGTDRGPGWGVQTRGYYLDVNRDGLVDFTQSYKELINGTVLRNTWINDGEKWVSDNSLNMNDVIYFDYHGRGRSKARSGSFIDINNDGSPDWVNAHKYGSATTLMTKLNSISRANLVDNIVTTAGVVVDPTFTPITANDDIYTKGSGEPESDAFHFERPMYVTSSLAVTNAIGGNNVSEYQYGGAQFHRKGRGFLGFRTFKSIDGASGITREAEYYQKFPLIGRVKESVVRETSVADTNKWLSKSTNEYVEKPLNGGKTVLPYMSVRTSETRELNENGAAKFAWSKQTSTLDDYGNSESSTVERGLSATNVLHRTDVTNVYHDALTNDWLVGRIDRVTTVLNEPQVSASTITRTNAYVFDSSKPWLLKSVIREPDSSDERIKLTTVFGYDEYGNIQTESQTSVDPDSLANVTRTNTIGYDSLDRLPVSLSNALQQTATIGYHAFCDAPNVVSDINQVETRYDYDNFCRQKDVTDAINIKTTTEYKFDGLSCSSCQIDPEFSVTTTREGEDPIEVFYSHYAQSLLSRTKGMSQGVSNVARTIEQQTHYDERGRVTKQSQPYFVGDAVQWSHNIYDKLSRPALSILAYDAKGTTASHPLSNGKAVIEYDYAIDSSGRQVRTVTDPLGNTKTVFANALGQIAEIRDHYGAPLSYDYSAQGNLIQTVAEDSVNGVSSTTNIGYDLLGRRTQLNDPSLGTTNFTYDGFSQLRSQTDASANTLAMRYDKLGRLIERDVPIQGGSIETSVWTYDLNLSSDTSAKAVGRISRIKRGNVDRIDEREFFYDEFGRPSGQRTWIREEEFKEAITYNVFGRVSSRAYPQSGVSNGTDNVFAVAYEYNNGYLKEISGLDEAGQKCITHWTADEYDALGRTKKDTLGTLVQTTRAYDPAQGVLDTIQSMLLKGANANNLVQDLSYVYDDNNNLKSRNDAQTSVFEEFTYDHLDRLETHTRTLEGASSVVSVAYDRLGNIRSKSDVGTYKYEDANKPYTLTRVDSSVTQSALAKFEVDWAWEDPTQSAPIRQAQPNIHDSNYEYNANGSITKQGDRRIYWTAFDKPHTMVRGEEGGTQRGSIIDYNADFERNFKQEGTFNIFGVQSAIKQTTYYVGKDYEKIVESDGSIKHRYTIGTGGGSIQIERDDNSNKDRPSYMLVDNLGSTNVVLNGLGEVEQRLEFDPWGMRVSGAQVGVVNSITNKGYTGHEMDDEVGLVNMNARIYDPYLGRFLSADPVLPDVGDLQAFNRYSYVYNNPLKYVDPTGNAPEFSRGCAGINSTTCITISDVDSEGNVIGIIGEVELDGGFNDCLSCEYDNIEDIRGEVPDEDNFSDPDNRANLTADELAEERETGGSNPAAEHVLVPYRGSPFRGAFQYALREGSWGYILGDGHILGSTVDSELNIEEFEKSVGPVGAVVLAVIGIRKDIVDGSAKKITDLVSKEPKLGGGATLDKLSPSEVKRIQNAADRSGTDITVVGSRVNPSKALHPKSDFDFVIDANSKTRNNLSRSLPGSKNVGEGVSGNQDIFKGAIDKTKPHVTFTPGGG